MPCGRRLEAWACERLGPVWAFGPPGEDDVCRVLMVSSFVPGQDFCAKSNEMAVAKLERRHSLRDRYGMFLPYYVLLDWTHKCGR